MGIDNSFPVKFSPKGLCDGFDATELFPGACRSLQNLVFDQSNPEIVIARPGVGTAFTTFSSFTTPGFISVQITAGNYIFGMISTGLTTGYDQPFCYNIQTGNFVTISGVTAGNAEGRPASPATSGAWTPPTMAIIGTKVIITHLGYTGLGSSFFGVIDISNIAAPAYSTTNTSGHGLPGVPTFVANYNNRAYFVVGNAVWYSDVLVPTTMTNAGQSLTVGDTSNITALMGLPVQTTSAGIAAVLLVFKPNQIWQVSGDASVTNSLALNYLSLSVGTQSPRSVASSPLGTFFAGPDTAYLVTALGAVVPVTAQLGGGLPDLRQPFSYCTQPTRAAAAFSANVYRICIPTIVNGTAGTWDYWFDTRKMRWNGPHTFVYDCVSQNGNGFIVSGAGSGAKLFNSTIFAYSTTSVYNDNGAAYNIDMYSCNFPKTNDMSMKQVVESTVELSSIGNSVNYNIISYNDANNLLAQTSVTTSQVGGIWGAFVWGDGTVWSGTTNQPRTYQINWPYPVVFNRVAIEINCPAASNVAIGAFYARYQRTGYLLMS